MAFQLPDGLAPVTSAGALTPLPQAAWSGRATGGTAGSVGLPWAPTTRAYGPIALPYRYSNVTLWATFATAGTVSVRRSGAEPADPLLDAAAAVLLSGAGAGAGRQFPLSVGLNHFELNSTLDGYYRFTLERLAQDVTAVALLPVAATPQFTPLPAIALQPPFQPDVLHYTLSVPAVVAQLQLLTDFATAGSLLLTQSVDGGTVSPVSGAVGGALPLAALPFAPLRTWFVLDSTQDGRYSVDVERLVFDTLAPLLQSYDAHGVSSGALTLVPPFATGIWQYRPPCRTAPRRPA